MLLCYEQRFYFLFISVVFSGDDDQEEGEEEKLPSCMDYIMHFVCLFWKVLFAFVPPTGKSSKDFSSAYKTYSGIRSLSLTSLPNALDNTAFSKTFHVTCCHPFTNANCNPSNVMNSSI